MTTAVDAVEGYLDTDLALHESLARGFLNVRKTARWLIETQGWEATEEAVVSALRRYSPDPGLDLENVLYMLKGSEVLVQTALATITLPSAREYSSAIPTIVQSVEPDDTLIILPERKRLNVLIDERNVDPVVSSLASRASLDPTKHCEVTQGLAALEVRFPEDGRVASTAVAVMINILGHRDVPVSNVYATLPTCNLVVAEEQVHQAYKNVEAMLSRF